LRNLADSGKSAKVRPDKSFSIRELATLNDPKRQKPNNNRKQSFQNKNPSPTSVAPYSIHVINGSSEKSTCRAIDACKKLKWLRGIIALLKAPAIVADEKNHAILVPSSDLLYQLDI
jgi:hypothetical protein